MLNARVAVLAVATLWAACTAAFADPPQNLDARVQELMQSSEAPAIAVAIVENGQVTHSRAYGVRRLGYPERADADTVFQIGSVSKNFTAAALGVLADRGELGWDEPVIDYMPNFRMYDSWVTREMTVRDLLVHRSGLGLGAGDLMFVPRTTRSRAEIVHNLRYLRPATSFRSAYAYDNVLYIAAGQLIEDVSGQTWEDFVRDNLLRPAGMRTAVYSFDGAWRGVRNRAWPHGRRDGPITGMGTQQPLDTGARGERGSELAAVSNPAGGIAASANDMARWIQVQLGHGVTPEGTRIFSEEVSRELWTPVVNMRINPPQPGPTAALTPQYQGYALGWNVREYRGHKVITHGGGVLGSIANLVLVPDLNIGFAIMTNSEDGHVQSAITYELLDHYMGQPHFDWSTVFAQQRQQRQQRGLEAVQNQGTTRAQIGPSLPLARYVGEYSDPWYGPISIIESNGQLVMDFKQTPGMIGDVTHWQYDTFRVIWRDPLIEPAFATFALGPDGAVERISMRPISPVADFSFDYQDLEITPVASAQ